MDAKSVILFGVMLAVLVTIASSKDCDVAEIGAILKPGEKAKLPGKCLEVTCYEDGSIGGLGCAAFYPGPGYKMSEIDYKKPYPDCCPTAIPL